MNKTLVLILGAFAIVLVYRRKEKFTSSEDPSFREGFVAGWITPGPITIIALTGFGLAQI